MRDQHRHTRLHQLPQLVGPQFLIRPHGPRSPHQPSALRGRTPSPSLACEPAASRGAARRFRFQPGDVVLDQQHDLMPPMLKRVVNERQRRVVNSEQGEFHAAAGRPRLRGEGAGEEANCSRRSMTKSTQAGRAVPDRGRVLKPPLCFRSRPGEWGEMSTE